MSEQTDFRQLRAWSETQELANQLEDVFRRLELAREREWLRHVIGEALDQLRYALNFVEIVPVADAGERPNFHLYSVAASAARTSLVFIDYTLMFMGSEEIIDGPTVEALRDRLHELETALVRITVEMQEFSVNYRPGDHSHRN